MRFVFFYEGQQIEYSLRPSKRARQYRICIAPGGDCTVIYPHARGIAFCHELVKKKAAWIVRAVLHLRKVAPPDLGREKENHLRYEKLALLRARDLIAEYAPLLRVWPEAVYIGRSRTRWGSCNKRGILRFSWRLATLPKNLARYIVVHELCHLAHFNHGKNFWKMVQGAIPDWRERRKLLAAKGLMAED